MNANVERFLKWLFRRIITILVVQVMSTPHTPEVLVIGAGPVGLFTALTLARRGVDVEIIDQEWRAAAHSYALALHPSSLLLLDEIGLIGEVLDQAYQIHTIGLYDSNDRKAEIRLSELDTKYPFVAVMPQSVIENLLVEALDRSGVQVKWNHVASVIRPRPDKVDITVDQLEKESMGYPIARTEWVVARNKEYQVPFAIGADGYHSNVRQAAGINFPQIGEPQQFAVFEFETDADFHGEMRIVMNEYGTNVLWPLDDGYCRWTFELEDFEVPPVSRSKDRFIVQLGDAAFPVLAAAELEPLLKARAPWFKGSIEEIHWRICVRFERRLASAFGKGRLWLAGDSGHMTGPVGVQSMNVGFREAYDLAGRIAAILRHEKQLGDLEAYSIERITEWRQLLGLDAALSPGFDTDPWIAERAPNLLACLPASGKDLEHLARQLKLSYSILQ